MAPPLPVPVEVVWRTSLLVLAPALLWLFHFFRRHEIAQLQALAAGILTNYDRSEEPR